MGISCSSSESESSLVRNQEITPQHPEQGETRAASTMSERLVTDFNSFLAANNTAVTMVKTKFHEFDALQKEHCELKTLYEQVMEDNHSLRQRMNNDSVMNHRSYQSDSEDVTSKNKRSDVLKRYQAMDGNKRRQAIEAFGKPSSRTELCYRKDLTCRIFVIAYNIARSTKDAFHQRAVPKFFQCAPSVGVNCDETSKVIERNMKQPLSPEMQSLLSTESFKVACSSVLKEMAVSCDLTELEEKMYLELKNHRDQWNRSEPWLPHLDDKIIAKMENYIKDCVRIAWRMVTLLPPLKIVLVNDGDLHDEQFDDFFQTEVEENKENTPTIEVCVWPALTDYNSDEVLVKGTSVIIPKPKQPKQHVV
ncbi:Mitochondria-eating protein [Desmophyllum pertusum]|uniref:Mitochondria-eating protein n=1 Tax=Desmophyllum pertusum TaxID=174260 RepID=A0A9W9YB78_9CNID|nr:Mitochondria-eating protein [Desmophyllum pertusum]